MARDAIAAAQQHVAENRARRGMALLGGELHPARRLARIALRAGAVQIEPREIVLAVRVAEIGGGIVEHIEGAVGIRLHIGALDAVEEITAERDEGAGDDARIRGAGDLVGILIRDLREILESLEIIDRNAVATGIDAAKLELCGEMPARGGEFERAHCAGLVAGRGIAHPGLQRVACTAEGCERQGGVGDRPARRWRDGPPAGERRRLADRAILRLRQGDAGDRTRRDQPALPVQLLRPDDRLAAQDEQGSG